MKRLCHPVRPCSRQVQLSTSIWVALIQIEWLTWFSPCISSPITEYNDRLSSLTWQKTNRTHTHPHTHTPPHTGVSCKTVEIKVKFREQAVPLSAFAWVCEGHRRGHSEYVATVTEVNIRLKSLHRSQKSGKRLDNWYEQRRDTEGYWQRITYTHRGAAV